LMITLRGCCANPELAAIKNNETSSGSLKFLITGLSEFWNSSNNLSIYLTKIPSVEHSQPTENILTLSLFVEMGGLRALIHPLHPHESPSPLGPQLTIISLPKANIKPPKCPNLNRRSPKSLLLLLQPDFKLDALGHTQRLLSP
jgi:hypothetical protein